WRALLPFVALFPRWVLGEALENLIPAVAGPRLVVRHRVALSLEMAQAERHGILADRIGDLVHVRVDRVDRVRRNGRAVGGDGRLVRQHLEAANLEGRPLVQTGQEHGAHGKHGAGERAGLDDNLAVERHQGPVALDAGLELDDHLWRRHPRDQLLAPGHHVAHGPPGHAGELRGDWFAQRADLAAEAAAAFHRNDLDAVLGDLEHVRDFAACVEGALRAGPERELAGGVPLREHGVRLEIALVDHRDAVRLFDDDVGFSESLRNVAARQLGLL